MRALLRELAPVLVAFSGGVDSTVVLKLALDELGPDRVLAVTAHGVVHTGEELAAAREAAARLGARHMVVRTDELAISGFATNPPERCFLCRGSMFDRLAEVAQAEGMKTVVDGVNRDDGADYRPGVRAAAARGVRSPLAEACLSKKDVRALARKLGLANWDLPASPCLASRFPYGEEITEAKLAAVAAGERHLRALGFANVRLRHGDILDLDPDSDPDLGEFDYIIAHGVYSWVPDPVRRHLLRLCRSLLAPHGVAYVSYNTLPGWRMRGMLRDLLRYAARGAETAADKLAAAHAAALDAKAATLA